MADGGVAGIAPVGIPVPGPIGGPIGGIKADDARDGGTPSPLPLPPALAQAMEAARAEAPDGGPLDGPAGLFGPESARWRVDRESALFLGAGRAMLLQLAHPWVAAAIAEHSDVLTNPVGRFHRTFGTVYALVFGTVRQAETAAHGLYRRHAAVTGRLQQGGRYRALDPAALAWVQATLTDTALKAHDLMLPSLPEAERRRYWEESRRLSGLFGVPAGTLPDDYADFRGYMRGMLRGGALEVTPEARQIAEQLFRGGSKPWLALPGWYRDLTAELLPRPLARAFGLEPGPAAAKRAGAALTRLRAAYARLPEPLRCVGPYLEARGRIDGRSRRSPLAALSNRLWIGRFGI
ncbi:MAG TPA: oxygenase MpaB family protein [Azospirillaceae bacterium]|nr:oxygenase MpaB family protein [Azospirillaceae bacterium]